MSDTTDTPRDKGGFRRIYRDKGSRKVLGFAVAAIVLAGGYALISGSGPAPEHSALRNAPSLPSVQGATPVTPEYARSLNKETGQNVQEAKRSGGSETPPLILPPTSGRLPTSLPGNDDETAPAVPTPLRQGHPLVVPVEVPVQRRPVQVAQAMQAAPRPVQVDQSLLQAMVRQMQQVTPQRPVAAQTMFIYSPGASGAPGQEASQSNSVGGQSSSYHGMSQQSQGGAQSASQQQVQPEAAKSRFIAPTAGTILYAHLLGRVNSDTPGPVIGEILQGPFTNARLLGSFQFSEQGVVMTFSTMTVPYKDENGDDQSEVVPIHAVAVDASHLGTAMATDIDRHLLERIGVAFGTAFLQGLGQAVAQSGSTVASGLTGTVVTNSTLNTKDELLAGAGSAAGAAGQVFNQVYGNRRTTVTVEAGTPMGLLFIGTGNGN